MMLKPSSQQTYFKCPLHKQRKQVLCFWRKLSLLQSAWEKKKYKQPYHLLSSPTENNTREKEHHEMLGDYNKQCNNQPV